MKKFVCSVCGYVYEGDAAPAECPVCHVGADKFKKVEGDLTLAAEHEYGVYAKTVKNNPEISDEDKKYIFDQLKANFEGECSEVGMYLAMDEGEITNVAVAPVERCHGVGGMLLTELLKIAENKGVARIVLEVRASNDSAIRLYERNGFVQCGMRKGFYEFPKEDAYVMVHGH